MCVLILATPDLMVLWNTVSMVWRGWWLLRCSVFGCGRLASSSKSGAFQSGGLWALLVTVVLVKSTGAWVLLGIVILFSAVVSFRCLLVLSIVISFCLSSSILLAMGIVICSLLTGFVPLEMLVLLDHLLISICWSDQNTGDQIVSVVHSFRWRPRLAKV